MKKIPIKLLILCLLSCSTNSNNESNPQSNSNIGQGGSLARFTISNNYLYTVDKTNINVFNVSQADNPVKVNSVRIGFNIETLFGYKDYLYIGSRNGMYIYSISNPESPTEISEVQHFTACDPVIANNTHAFVTLHSDIGCGTTINVLEVYDITNIESPVLVSSRNLTKPIGIGLYYNYLIVCDDEVKIFDASVPENISLITSINREAFDVIVKNDLLILIGANGLYQYKLDNDNIETIKELSSINI